MFNQVLRLIFGTKNQRVVKSFTPIVTRINELESKYQAMTDSELASQTIIFKEQLANGKPLDDLLTDAFAVVREAGKRVLNMRHFDVQLMGGLALHRGMIAEMRTGEGKTLVATLPSYLNALTGKGVHVVTVNDYLARRDAEWMGQIHRFLGLQVGVVYNQMREAEKRQNYGYDITYAQNNEIGFDYLRDNMKFSLNARAQRGLNFAIVDEVDSILIDEARTPLIISGPAQDSTELYAKINKIVPNLLANEHFEIDLKSRQIDLTDAGMAKAESLLNITNLYDPENIEILHHVQQALRAHQIMTRDVDYIVQNRQIIIVDEFTGRLMPGRRWGDGLHQAIEAKEGVPIARENQTIATITFQNLFRLYSKLSGMTGTAITEAAEFNEIYNLDVLIMPTNKPMVRKDFSDAIFRSHPEKVNAVVNDIIDVHKSGQPILVGTVSIEQSELFSKMLTQKKVEHQVLNAKHHALEAEIVAQAGRLNAVTIATNMAGRGTDVLLGGNPEMLASKEVGTNDQEDPDYQEALAEYKEICAEERDQVLAAGGLFIIGTERHESRRIDNQLRGRAGRQGDPGKSRFYISLEDDLMKRFGGERLQHTFAKLGWEDGVAIENRIVSAAIENAQSRVERHHFEQRKNITKYDDVLSKQRLAIYGLRDRVLNNEDLRTEILDMLDDLLEDLVLAMCDAKTKQNNWDLAKLTENYKFLTNRDLSVKLDGLDQQQIFSVLQNQAHEDYVAHSSAQNLLLEDMAGKYKTQGVEIGYLDNSEEAFDFRFATVEQSELLRSVDKHWLHHLEEMDHLREGINLRAYSQQNPLHEYQKEGFKVFHKTLIRIKEQVIRQLFYFEASHFSQFLEHLKAEQQRRQKLLDQAASAGAEDSEDLRDPGSSKDKMRDLRKARRKLKKG